MLLGNHLGVAYNVACLVHGTSVSGGKYILDVLTFTKTEQQKIFLED